METLKNSTSSRHFDYGLNLNDYLYDPEIVIKLRRERIKMKNPCNHSKFFTLESENSQYQYGAMFEPHIDKQDANETTETFQFCFWYKKFVFFHIANNRVVVVKPTLEPITFDFQKLHGFVHKDHISKLKHHIKRASLSKLHSVKGSYSIKAMEPEDHWWWTKRLCYWDQRLLFIGKFYPIVL